MKSRVVGFALSFVVYSVGPNASVAADKDVNVINTPDVNVVNAMPIDVTGDVNVLNDIVGVEVLNDGPIGVEVTNTNAPAPIQFTLEGIYNEIPGALFNTLMPTSGDSNEFTIPDGVSMVIQYVNCKGNQPTGTAAYLLLEGFLEMEFSIAPVELASFPLEATGVNIGSDRELYRADRNLTSYLGITSPNGPDTQGRLRLQGLRNPTTGGGAITCLVAGQLLPD